jgi:hypothetical protein
MNKIISVLVLVALFLPMIALAADYCKIVADLTYINSDCKPDVLKWDIDGDGNNDKGYVPVDTYGTCCLFNSIHVVTNWLSGIIAALVGIFIIIGAVMIITAGGVPEKVSRGRNYILYAVVGMIAFVFAKAIPSIAKAILGM